VWGEFRLARAEVPHQVRDGINSAPAALLSKSRPPKKSFVFLLEEKIGRAQIKKCEENFFAKQRAKRAAAGRSVQNSQSGFSSKKVRILSNKHHKLMQIREVKTAIKVGDFVLRQNHRNKIDIKYLPTLSYYSRESNCKLRNGSKTGSCLFSVCPEPQRDTNRQNKALHLTANQRSRFGTDTKRTDPKRAIS